MTGESPEPLVDAVERVVDDELVREHGEPFDIGRDQRSDERIPSREMPVERADAYTGFAGDLVERCVETALFERRVGNLEQSLAIALCIGAQRASLGVGRCGHVKGEVVKAEAPSVY